MKTPWLLTLIDASRNTRMTLAITFFFLFLFLGCVLLHLGVYCHLTYAKVFLLTSCLKHLWNQSASGDLKRNLSRRLLQIEKWSPHPSLRWLLIDPLEAILTQCLKHWIETKKWLTFHCKLSSALKEMFFHYVEWSSEIDCHHDTNLSKENLKGHFNLSWYELKRLK